MDLAESNYADAVRAIENGEFTPHFQPLVDLRTGGLYGFELLARWFRPKQGWIPPDEFIPLAESEGWIDLLTRELLRKGFSAFATLPGSLALSINISPVQLRDLSLPDQIQTIAATAGFATDRLIVEITESALADEAESARVIAQAFKSMGARLALDDFGTGYSSLLHLQSLPFDELKVDRSFVGAMTEQRDSRKIVAAVVGLGQSLGLTTVAEGVETAEQAEMLRWMGCELGQGWLFGRPVPAEGLVVVLENCGQSAVEPFPNSLEGRVSLGTLDSLPAQRLAQLQAVYDGAPVGLAFLDREMRYRNLNRRLANMNGRPMSEHLGRTVEEVIPEFFAQVEPFIRRALSGEAVTGVELTKPAVSPNGGTTILLSYEPARDEAGEVVGVSVAISDVTPIKQAQAAQRETQEHFRSMLELLPQIPWIVDPEGRALDVSQRWLELTGTAHDDWRGYGWMDSLHPDDCEPTWAAMRHAFATGEPIDMIYRLRKSENDPWKRLRSRGAARFGEDGKVICWYGCLEEVEEPSAPQS
jgi:PAS domain S-box-containing protein